MGAIARRMITVLSALLLFAAPAQAQWRVGGFIGAEHESSWDEFLVIGADALKDIGSQGLQINPRFSYFLREFTTRFQVDVNFIKPLELVSKPRIMPYLGLGLALENVSYDNSEIDSESNVGFNYVVGATTNGSGSMKPFAQFQYSVLNDAPNNAVVTLGLHFSLGSK